MSDAYQLPPEKLIHGDTAFFTFSTLGYLPFVRNLHASLLRSDPELAEHLIVFCPDERTEQECFRHGLFGINCDAGGVPDLVRFQGPGFRNLMSYKYRLAREVLRQARYAWWCDGDIVVNAPLIERVTSLMKRSDADLIMQYEWPKNVPGPAANSTRGSGSRGGRTRWTACYGR